MYSITKYMCTWYTLITWLPLCMEKAMLLAHTRKFPAALMRKFVMTWSPLSGNIFPSFLLFPHPQWKQSEWLPKDECVWRDNRERATSNKKVTSSWRGDPVFKLDGSKIGEGSWNCLDLQRVLGFDDFL